MSTHPRDLSISVGLVPLVELQDKIEQRQAIIGVIGRLTHLGKGVRGTSKPDGQLRQCLYSSKAERLSGSKAKVPFEKELRHTVEWYERILFSARGQVIR